MVVPWNVYVDGEIQGHRFYGLDTAFVLGDANTFSEKMTIAQGWVEICLLEKRLD